MVLLAAHAMRAEDIVMQTVRGQVHTEDPGATIEGATVSIIDVDPPITTITDSLRRFSLRVPRGRHMLQVSHIGYEPFTAEILVAVGRENVINVELQPASEQLGDVVVTGTYNKRSPANRFSFAGARSFSIDETYRFASSLGDPARMVRSFAGIMPVNDSRNDIVIRGNSPTGVQWILDGIEVSNPNHFNTGIGMTGGQVSYLNTNLLTNSDFYLSAWPSQYGNALSGIFDLQIRPANTQRHEFWVQSGFGGLEVGAEGYFSRRNPSTYLASYRYSFPDILHHLGVKMAVVPRYQDATAKVHIQLAENHSLDVLGLWSQSHIHFMSDEEGTSLDEGKTRLADLPFALRVALDSRAYIGGVIFNARFSSLVSLRTIFSFVRPESEMQVDTVHPSQGEAHWQSLWHESAVEDKYSFSTQIDWNATRGGLLVGGVKGDLFSARYGETVVVGQASAEGAKDFAQGSHLFGLVRAYAQYRQSFTSSWAATLGVHGMYLTINGQYAVEPRFGVKYRPSAAHTIGFSGGLYSQMLPRSFYFLKYIGRDGVEQRNLKADFSRSAQVDLFYDWAFAEQWHFKAEAYYQYLYRVPVSGEENSTWTILEAAGAGRNFVDRESNLANRGLGQNYGVELTVEKFFSRGYYLLANATYYRSRYAMGKGQPWWSTVFDGQYLANLSGGYEWQLPKWVALYADVKGSYGGGVRYTPLREDVFAATHRLELDRARVNTLKAKDYFRLDVKVGVRVLGKRHTQDFAVDLQNVTNRRNVLSIAYNNRTGEAAPMLGQGFSPMVTYRLWFSVK